MKETQEINKVTHSPLLFVDLSAVIVGITDQTPHVFIVDVDDKDPIQGLPGGKFDPKKHQKMQQGLRIVVQEKTGFSLRYVEQLYSFGDNGRMRNNNENGHSSISIGYLALTHAQNTIHDRWLDWYHFFPWEDWRNGMPSLIRQTIYPLLKQYAEQKKRHQQAFDSWDERMYEFFAFGNRSWDPERVLERYEILYEAGFVNEAVRDGKDLARRHLKEMGSAYPQLGQELHLDHRRILATAISRLRAKIKYRPVIFDVMPEKFTLFTLQKTIEGIYGMPLHKQNFRRHVMKSKLVYAADDICIDTGGRPAQLYRFADHLSIERAQLSLLPPTRR